MSYFEIFVGFAGIVIWLFLFVCLFFFRIKVDRFMAKVNFLHVFVLIGLMCLLPYSISLVADCCGIKPYDLLYEDNLYGRGSDIEAKLEYRNNIIDQLNEEVDDPSLVGTVYHHFRGIGSMYSAGTPKGRAWAFAIGAFGLLFIGALIIPAVLQVVSRCTTNFLEGRTRYNIQKSPYAVIFGAHPTVPELIHKILSPDHEQKIKYVIILTTSNVLKYRNDLEALLSPGERSRVIFYQGSRRNPAEIKKLNLERAKEVYVLGEPSAQESESEHDSKNMECIRIIAQELRDKHCKKPLLCYSLFDYQTTIKTFYHSDLSEMVREQIEFVYINYYSNWAQNVFSVPQSNEPGKIKYLPLEGSAKIDKDSDKYVHLVIVGMTKMGNALAYETAYIAHYPNFCSKNLRTKITFIDLAAEKESAFVRSHLKGLFELCRWRLVDMNKEMPEDVVWNDPLNEMAALKRAGKPLPFEQYPYSHLADPNAKDSNFIDVEWEFLVGDTETPNVKKYLEQCATNPNELLTVSICQKKANESIAASFYLPTEVYRNAIQILVYQKQSADIINNISGMSLQREAQARMRYQKLRPFGMLSSCFSNRIVDNRLAKLVNYVYNCTKDTKLSCATERDAETGLQNQEVYWRKCLVANQWSSLYNAFSITTKLRFMGVDYHNTPASEMVKILRDEETLDILTEVEHNRWNTEKLMMGFRPLNDKEIAPLLEMIENGADTNAFSETKKNLKLGWEMAHLNICSFETLKKYDAPAVHYDVVMTKAFPALVEWMRDNL